MVRTAILEIVVNGVRIMSSLSVQADMQRGKVDRISPEPVPTVVHDLVVDALAARGVEYYERTDGSICIEAVVDGETREFTLRIHHSG